MNVDKWGPGGWVFLHTISFNYPEKPTKEDKNKYIKFFNLVGEMLPCKYCRNSYKIYIKYIPIKKFIDSREGVTYWLYFIHNLVNDKIFKDERVSFEEVVKKYEGFRAGCKKLKKKNSKKKVYGSCKVPKKKTTNDKILQFVENAEKKYKSMMKKYILNLMKCNDNPNKTAMKLKNK